MHPELLRALGRARHEDLLSERHIRPQPSVRLHEASPRFPRSRQWVGSLLIWAGGLLVGNRQAALELAHK
jgi:hypothetical protein